MSKELLNEKESASSEIVDQTSNREESVNQADNKDDGKTSQTDPKRKRTIAIAVIVVLLVVVVGAVAFYLNSPGYLISKGDSEYNAGNYAEAAKIYVNVEESSEASAKLLDTCITMSDAGENDNAREIISSSSSSKKDIYLAVLDALVADSPSSIDSNLIEKASQDSSAAYAVASFAAKRWTGTKNEAAGVEKAILLLESSNDSDKESLLEYCNQRKELIKDFNSANDDYLAGNLPSAQKKFESLDENFAIDGVSVKSRKESLAAHQDIVDVCGTYGTSTAHRYTYVSNSSRWMKWEDDGGKAQAKVSATINDDGSATVSCQIAFQMFFNTNMNAYSRFNTSVDFAVKFSQTSTNLPVSYSTDTIDNFYLTNTTYEIPTTVTIESGSVSYSADHSESGVTIQGSGTLSKTSSDSSGSLSLS